MNKYLIFGGILLALSWLAWDQHDRYVTVSIEYENYRLSAEKEAKQQEKDNEDKIKVALADRDAALASLLDSQVRSRALRNSITPAGPERICYSRSAFDTALSTYLAGVENLLADGDKAVVDNKAWLSAWPR